jgi:hypothetical protein
MISFLHIPALSNFPVRCLWMLVHVHTTSNSKHMDRTTWMRRAFGNNLENVLLNIPTHVELIFASPFVKL